MPAQPEGGPAPRTGALPEEAAARAGAETFSAYVHVPYCRVRCGYCDFNTYTAEELGPGANREDYREQLGREIALSRRVLADTALASRPFDTVFFGGGTPTLLPAETLAGVLEDLRAGFGLAADAEVTTEANPDSVDAAYFRTLRSAGFTRVSLGMQSAVPHVLDVLDRTHDPARIGGVVAAAKEAGLQVSLDLIYGTPGESLADWRTSLEAVLAHRPDHVSAYSLIVEPGTRMGAQVRRGELPMPAEDDLADKYELADALLGEAGLQWYEVSNFATAPGSRCRHNLAYWRGADWWGYGPGAHSHIGGVRWWNAKHPRAWAGRLEQEASPAVGREVLDADTRALEEIMLALRVDGEYPLARLADSARPVIARLLAEGLLGAETVRTGRIHLTLRGRLLADGIVRELADHLR
ncbi:radical SAM family heme chaperone HemW [Brevibacterium album]|uniref:radical SAM family heme chaperone HemW n=1 Tax=Brevibacterium album TaxID=417948 RepID=UPI000413477B|nr:radical SAM family heme chaperone HemW [Brevibacterium album]